MKKVKIVDFDGTQREYIAECPYCGIELDIIERGAGPIIVEANHCPHFIDVDWYDQKASFGSKEDEKMKLSMKRNDRAIIFEDKDKMGRVKGSIGFQVSLKGYLIVYIKGYKVDAKKFPGLKGYHGYELTDTEMDELVGFFEKIEKKTPRRREKRSMNEMTLFNREPTDCPDCGVSPGESHKDGCDVEKCSVCGGQKIGCNCTGHDELFARWTGWWPGELEAAALGTDMNQLCFNKLDKLFFVKPKKESEGK